MRKTNHGDTKIYQEEILSNLTLAFCHPRIWQNWLCFGERGESFRRRWILLCEVPP